MIGSLRNIIVCVLVLTGRFSAYGQMMDFRNILKLPATINSPYEETMPLLSPDGKTLYFTRLLHPENMGGEYGGSDIWVSHGNPATGNWGKASNRASTFNTKGNNSMAGVNAKGNTVYILNTTGLYFTKKTAEGWEKPEPIHIPDFKPDGFTGVFVSPWYDVILLSMNGKGSKGKEDLYVSIINAEGHWSGPVNLGAVINSSGFEISPFLSKDKKRLYFSSNGHGGAGDADIFYSDRLSEAWDSWSEPVNLGSEINSPFFDAYFSIYGDTLALFASSKEGVMGDIYQTRVKTYSNLAGRTKKYLSDNETQYILGAALTEITFDKDVATLSSSQNKLLSYIFSKFGKLEDINIQLLTNGYSDSTVQARLNAIAERFEQLGLPKRRIDIIKEDKDPSAQAGTIKLSFFR